MMTSSRQTQHEAYAVIVERLWESHGLRDMRKYGHMTLHDGAIAALKDVAADLIEVGRVLGRTQAAQLVYEREREYPELASALAGKIESTSTANIWEIVRALAPAHVVELERSLTQIEYHYEHRLAMLRTEMIELTKQLHLGDPLVRALSILNEGILSFDQLLYDDESKTLSFRRAGMEEYVIVHLDRLGDNDDDLAIYTNGQSYGESVLLWHDGIGDPWLDRYHDENENEDEEDQQ